MQLLQQSLLTYLAALTDPARITETQEAVDLILTVTVDARVRIALVNLCNDVYFLKLCLLPVYLTHDQSLC